MEIFNALPEPVRANLAEFLKIGGCILLALGIAALFFRLLFGKRSAKNHAVSSVFSILFMYVVTIVVLTFASDYQALLAPLPFVTLSGDQLILFSLKSAGFTAICSEVLDMIILSFLVNLIDQFMREGNSLLYWLLLRCLTVGLALFGNLLLAYVTRTYIPESFRANAPAILVIILVAMFAFGALRIPLGAVLGTVNPLLGALYTFFFATLVGRQLSKAVLTAAILTTLVYAFNSLGIVSFTLSAAALAAYLPFLAVMLVAWFLTGKIM